jgi:hypothetical protein
MYTPGNWLRSVTLWATMVMVLACQSRPAASQETWVTYRNERFGTTIEYPVDWFANVTDRPANDDGRIFVAPDGAELSISAGSNVLGDSLAHYASSIFQHLPAGAAVTYQTSGTDWFVLSGLEHGTIFYDRYLFGPNAIIHHLSLRFPGDRKSFYEPIVTRVSRSLRAGQVAKQ